MAERTAKNPRSELRAKLQQEPAERFIHRTFRTDWTVLTTELFRMVIDGVPFGVALATRQRSRFRSSLEIRVNHEFPTREVPEFVRRQFRPRHYERIFRSTEGMEREGPFDLYKIVSPKLGLPMNCLVYRVDHSTRKDLTALLVFGGERLEGQLEERLAMVSEIMEARQIGQVEAEAAVAEGEDEDTSREEELIARLRLMNPRTINTVPVSDIAAVVNGLETVIEAQSPQLQAKYRVLSDYLIGKRVG